jgi:capsular exopolysaccharide synthesis family protein
MGRIAEALKKAQQERAEKLRLRFCETAGAQSPSVAVLDTPASESPLEARSDREAAVPSADTILHNMNFEPRRIQHGASLFQPATQLRPTAQHETSSGVPALGLTPSWDVHPSVIAVHDRNSSITEQYRAVRTWLLRQAIGEQRSCLAVTSSVAKEGKTLTAANLAAVMAEIRHLKILAVDADLRRGQLAGLLKLPSSPGLADAIAGRATLDEAIHATPLGNLFVVPAGECRNVNPAEMVNSTVLARLFEEFRDRYDFVLVDTPPVQRLSDTGVIGALCTGILVVVRMSSTPAPLVQQSLRWLQSNNLNVVGCIATCCDAGAAQPSYQDAYAYNE